MEYRTFVRWNIIGGTIWAFGVTLLGYFLGQVEVIEQNLELAILTVVAISCLPIAFEVLKARREKRAQRGRRRRPRPARARPRSTSSTRPVTPTASSSPDSVYARHRHAVLSAHRSSGVVSPG